MTAAFAPAAELSFEKDVRPILKTHCTHCHGEEEKPSGGVDLRLRRFMDKTMDDGSHLLVPGKPGESGLIKIIRSGEMPKKGKKLPEPQLAILERWITEGAKTTGPEPETLAPGTMITEEDRQFWSFRPIANPAPPSLADAARVRTPVDAFILTKLRENQLDFAPDAEKTALIRRVTMDLTGLPPTLEEISAFEADTTPDAYEKVVDRLLASPAYGERWGRHWLDVAGYADSNGFAEVDSIRPEAWRYRDYVIRAFNADKPWTDFIAEQLAGDELAGVTQDDTATALGDEKRREAVIATGFLRMAPDGTGDAVPDAKLARNQTIAEEMKVVSSALLGLTVGCAQCHDHRYDPITQADYYRFRAIFEPAFNWQNWRGPNKRHYSLYTPEERARAEEIEKQAAAIDAESRAMSRRFLDQIFEKEILKLPEPEREPYRAARAKEDKDRTPEQKALIKKYPSALALYSLDLYDVGLQKQVTDKAAEATKLRATKPAEGFVMALTEVKGAVPEMKLFHRGDHDQPKQTVTPGELGVLSAPEIEPFKPAAVPSGSSGRRLAYARWLTSGKHPLVARVLVNRFWMHHFGRGIVNTPGDFGVPGDRPTHPELLDWLATRFMEGGWRLKPLHRLLVLSTVYRQSSTAADSLRTDSDNRLLGRFKMQRLGAEAVRDSLLAAAGTLNPVPFGPPVGIARDPEGRIVTGTEQLNANGDVTGVTSAGDNGRRRALYVQVRRKLPLTVLEAFDAPVMTPNCELRNSTTVAPQSLLLMNDNFILDTSRALAARLRKELPGDARGQITRAWRLLFGTTPGQEDVAQALVYLTEQAETVRASAKPPAKDAPPLDAGLEALASYCQVLSGSNRFLYLE